MIEHTLGPQSALQLTKYLMTVEESALAFEWDRARPEHGMEFTVYSGTSNAEMKKILNLNVTEARIPLLVRDTFMLPFFPRIALTFVPRAVIGLPIPAGYPAFHGLVDFNY